MGSVTTLLSLIIIVRPMGLAVTFCKCSVYMNLRPDSIKRTQSSSLVYRDDDWSRRYNTMAPQLLVTMILTGEITDIINIHGNMNGNYVTSHCIPYQWEIPQYDDGKLCNPETG